MRDLETLASHCMGSVFLEINPQRNEYVTVREYLNNGQEYRDFSNLDDLTRQRMIDLDTLYSLQFYPLTPIGFHLVFGANFFEVLQAAGRVMNVCQTCWGGRFKVSADEFPHGTRLLCGECGGRGIKS